MSVIIWSLRAITSMWLKFTQFIQLTWKNTSKASTAHQSVPPKPPGTQLSVVVRAVLLLSTHDGPIRGEIALVALLGRRLRWYSEGFPNLNRKINIALHNIVYTYIWHMQRNLWTFCENYECRQIHIYTHIWICVRTCIWSVYIYMYKCLWMSMCTWNK